MKSRSILALFALVAPCMSLEAGDFNPGKVADYGFETVLANPITSIKDQHNSGTCWCFATTSFLESEAIRMGKADTTVDFSEMYSISKGYRLRAVKYLRMNGHLTSGPGSIAPDLLHLVDEFGIVPQSAMPGKTELPELFEMDKEIKAYLQGILEDKSKLKTDWSKGLDKILTRWIGREPSKFTVGGHEFTPASYRDQMGISADDYVTLSSFTHHPFYQSFALEVPDNWRSDCVLNVTLNELQEAVDSAVRNGYTVCWGADITEPGYTWDGLMVLPLRQVSQEMRQEMFDTQETTDDHLMHIFGLAKDSAGEMYYMVKNSSGPNWGDPNHIWYASVPYLRAKTIAVTLHKDALSPALKEKLGIK